MTGHVLLDATTHLIKGIASELDDMEGIEDAGCVLELIVDGVLSVPGRGPAPWDDPPSRQVHDASELTGAPAASVLVMPHASHQPPAPEPPQKRAGSSDAARRHGLIWDHTVFHVVASCRARPAIVAPSKRNCRIAQRIARTMSTTESHSEGLSNQVARRLGPERTSALHGASPGRL